MATAHTDPVIWPCNRCGAGVTLSPVGVNWGDSRGWDYDLVEYTGECDNGDCMDDLTIKVREPQGGEDE